MCSKSRWKSSGAFLAAAVLLALGTLAVYHALTLDGRVLASFDAQVYFYPNATFLASSLRSGRVPLWNPYLFGGVPFLANSQVGALYFPNLLYLVLDVGRAYAWLVALHVWWMALGAYALARGALHVSFPAALVAALTFGLGGYAAGTAGHLNQLAVLSWLPWMTLGVERAVAERRSRPALLAALAVGSAVLAGHTQALYIGCVVAGCAGLSRVFEHALARPPRRPNLAQLSVLVDLARLALPFALGIAISAAQLLPTLELTRLGFRSGGLAFRDAAAFSLPPWLALQSLLPTVGQASLLSEWIGYVGISAIALALIGAIVGPAAVSRWLVGASLVGLVLCFGEFTPVYPLAYLMVPGMSLFRVPARWLMVWSLGVALLAALGMDVVLYRPGWTGEIRATVRGWVERASRRRRLVFPILGLLAVVVLAGVYLLRHYRRLIGLPSATTLAVWAASLLILIVLARLRRRWPSLAAAGIVALVLAEAGLGSMNVPFNDAVWPDAVEALPAPASALVAEQRRVGASGMARVLALSDNSFDPGDLPQLKAMLAGTLPDTAIAEYLSAVKRVEDLTPNVAMQLGLRTVDGYDGGLLPLGRYPALKLLFPVEGENLPDGRLDLQLRSAPDPRLLAGLNVGYVSMDRLRDRWIDGVYYDLAITTPLRTGQDLRLDAQPMPANAVGVILHVDPAARGTLVASIGRESVRQSVAPGESSGAPLQLSDGAGAVLVTIEFPTPTVARDVTLRWDGAGDIALRSISLIDRRTNASEPVVASPDYELIYLGDVKIYHNLLTLPHAYLARGLTVVPDELSLLDTMRSSAWVPADNALTAAASPGIAFPPAPLADDRAVVALDEPGAVDLDVRASARRVIVLSEFDYPGWTARVDGAPVPLIRTNGFFMGVAVDAGTHRVSFRFEPPSWRQGLIISGIALVVCLAALIAPRTTSR